MRAIDQGDPALRCPVCGVTKLTMPPYADYSGEVPATPSPPYGEFRDQLSYEVCPSCGFEFGNDDNAGGDATPDSFEDYRRE